MPPEKVCPPEPDILPETERSLLKAALPLTDMPPETDWPPETAWPPLTVWPPEMDWPPVTV